MDLHDTARQLVVRWVRDVIGQHGASIRGAVWGRMSALGALDLSLSNLPEDRWFDALPPNGGARVFFEGTLLPQQRAERRNDQEMAGLVLRCIRGLRDDWMPLLVMQWQTFGEGESHSLEIDLVLSTLDGSGFSASGPTEMSRLYFAFVEDVELVPARHAIYGPDGLPISGHVMHRGLRHLRFAGLLAGDFLQLVARINAVDPDSVTPTQRQIRGGQLRRFLTDTPLPILEFFIDPESKELAGMEIAFGNWCVLGMDDSATNEDVIVRVVDPDADEPALEQGGLKLLAPAPGFWRERLLDIFSLVHVPDADFETDELIGGTPANIPPMAPPAGKSDEVAPPEIEQAEAMPFSRRGYYEAQ
ncbi:MAG TPA: hypothetical protein VM240_01060 [Verrucomicrobiae bacterium]|nr:hypothetical protein [Verrucomicrobiae bacterium]